MSEPLARLYDLALRTLAEQERRADALDDATAFYTWMIEPLSVDAGRLERELVRVTRAFTGMLCGVLVMLCGLAIATLLG